MKYLALILLLPTLSWAQPNVKYCSGMEMWANYVNSSTANLWNAFDPEKPYPYSATGDNGFGGILALSGDRSGYGKTAAIYTGHPTVDFSTYKTFIQTNAFASLRPPFYLSAWGHFNPAGPFTSDVRVLSLGDALHNINVYWKTTGKIALAIDGVIKQTGTVTAPATYAFLKLYSSWHAISGTTTTYLVFNGDSLVDHTALDTGTVFARDGIGIGWGSLGQSGDNTSNNDITWDDIILKDSSSSNAADNTFADPSAAILFLPVTTDSSNDHWRGGAGGTSTLVNGVKSIPPVGSTTETNNSQIIDTTNSATENFRATTQSYSGYGIPSNYRIRGVQGIVRVAAHATGNTDKGAMMITSNPQDPYESRFAFDTTTTHPHVIDYNTSLIPGFQNAYFQSFRGPWNGDPTIDRSTGATILVGKRTASSNRDEVSQMGVLVMIDNTPAPAGTVKARVIHDR